MPDVPLPQPDAPATPLVPEGRVRVSETFVSIQGEGKLTGTPSWFVRLSGCNLRCVWCDTPYASWRPEGPVRAVEELVREGVGSDLRHAVVTGGEPMIFDAVEPLVRGLRAEGMHVTIETAGTVFRDVDAQLMSISPKLANSTPPPETPGGWAARHEGGRINLPALQGLLDRYPERQLKFVVSRREDLDEIDTLLDRLRGWGPGDVLLMPEGVTVPGPERRALLVEACITRGWRYCQRLHIELFGNTRGT